MKKINFENFLPLNNLDLLKEFKIYKSILEKNLFLADYSNTLQNGIVVKHFGPIFFNKDGSIIGNTETSREKIKIFNSFTNKIELEDNTNIGYGIKNFLKTVRMSPSFYHKYDTQFKNFEAKSHFF